MRLRDLATADAIVLASLLDAEVEENPTLDPDLAARATGSGSWSFEEIMDHVDFGSGAGGLRDASSDGGLIKGEALVSGDDHEGVSRRHALRLVLGQGAEIARERDRVALALDQEAALDGARIPPKDAGSTPAKNGAGTDPTSGTPRPEGGRTS